MQSCLWFPMKSCCFYLWFSIFPIPTVIRYFPSLSSISMISNKNCNAKTQKQVLQLLGSLQPFQIVSLTKPNVKTPTLPLIICSKLHTWKKWKTILHRPESTQKHKIKLQQPPILMVSKFDPLLFYALCFCCRLHLSTSVSTKDESKALYVEYFMNNSNIWVN